MNERIRRVGRYGPRCSTAKTRRLSEIFAPDYIPSLVPKFVLDKIRAHELDYIKNGSIYSRMAHS